MTKLESFIRKHYNLTDRDEANMPAMLVRLTTMIDSGDYDSPCGRLSEYMLYDMIEDVMCELSA